MAFQIHVAAMAAKDGACQIETYAHAFFLLGGKERRAGACGDFRGEPAAEIADVDTQFDSIPAAVHFDALGRGVGSVVEQIDQRLP